MRQVHTIKQRLNLAAHIQSNYTQSGLTDREFADAATELLGFEIRDHHVKYLRGELEIPGNKPSAPPPTSDRLLQIERRLDEIEQFLKFNSNAK